MAHCGKGSMSEIPEARCGRFARRVLDISVSMEYGTRIQFTDGRKKDMKRSRLVRPLFFALWLCLLGGGVFVQAQPAKEEYKPQVGQEGKDVVWVPTPQALVDKMLDMAKVTPQDYVIDLGSGDGRTVITAA